MTVVLSPQLYSAKTFLLARTYEQMSFDLNDPKILLGLLLGICVALYATAIPVLITKWLLFRWALESSRPPSSSRFCIVALLEPICLIVATVGETRHDVPVPLLRFVVYAVLAMLPNMLLFSSLDRKGGAAHYFLKRSHYAFAVGLIYLGWWFLRSAGIYWI
jgi:hypothetical protein